MEIRIRETGQVMHEREFKNWLKQNNGPSYDRLTPEVMEILQVDPVFEGPQAQNLEWWQYSLRQGLEEIEGKWYTKYVPGPLFETQQEQDDYITQKTLERNQNLFRDIQERAQQRLDDFAKTRNYSGILSLCTYATSTNVKFQTEGQYGVQARDNTWATLYEILDEVQTGTRPMPSSYADIEPELPVLSWPN